MKRFSRLVSFVAGLWLVSCGSHYKNLEGHPIAASSALSFAPHFNKVLYRCVVDGRVVFKRFHLSGLLFFKSMEDGSTRAIFQNEMGFTFFDFGWDGNDSFQVNQIIPQLDKPALISTLRKDLNLLLMKNLDTSSEQIFSFQGQVLHRFQLSRGTAYYFEEKGGLQRIENWGKRKVTTILLSSQDRSGSMPDSVSFQHHKANFTIQLHRIEEHVD